MTNLKTLAGLTLALALTGAATAQTPAPAAAFDIHTDDCSKAPNRTIENDCARARAQIKTFYLQNVSAQNDANEILVAVRNLADPAIKVYLVASHNAIVVETYPEEIAKIEALIRELDKPHIVYRLTFTLNESEAGKHISTRHFSLVALEGQRSTLKQGSRVPVVTGTYDIASSTAQRQNSYMDVGMAIDITLSGVGNNLTLKSKVEESVVAPEKSATVPSDPIINQSIVDGVSAIAPGKALTLGTIEVPNSPRQIEIQVTVEPVS